MSITYVYILYVWMYEGAYTVSRAEAICHAIAASGAKKSVNFMEYMGIFHLLSLVHGNIPRSFQWVHEQFSWKYFHGFEYKYCKQCISNLGVKGSNPKWNKNNLQGKKIQYTLQVFSIEKVKAQINI
jgi:hypothetical protein